MHVPIDKIVIDDSTQPRGSISRAIVIDMIECIRSSEPLPAIVVYREGDRYWLADGWHRITAHREAGRVVIEAIVHKGTARDAFLAALSHNRGVPLTAEERKEAARKMVSDPEWSKWSDREIARRCGVAPTTVAGLRPASVQNGQIAQPPEAKEETKSSPGPENEKVDPVKPIPGRPTGATARVRAILAERPHATAVTIAREVGCDKALVGRLKRKMPGANEPAKSVTVKRNGKEYEMKTPARTGDGLRRLSKMAWGIAKDSKPATENPAAVKRSLAVFNRSLQMAIAKRLRDGESASVKEAADQIMKGAPVTLWEKAYAAVCALEPDDRARLCRMVLEECKPVLSVVK